MFILAVILALSVRHSCLMMCFICSCTIYIHSTSFTCPKLRDQLADLTVDIAVKVDSNPELMACESWEWSRLAHQGFVARL
jgi:hypothetical protein